MLLLPSSSSSTSSGRHRSGVGDGGGGGKSVNEEAHDWSISNRVSVLRGRSLTCEKLKGSSSAASSAHSCRPVWNASACAPAVALNVSISMDASDVRCTGCSGGRVGRVESAAGNRWGRWGTLLSFLFSRNLACDDNKWHQWWRCAFRVKATAV